MVAHNKSAAKRVGVPQAVGKEFAKADTGTKLLSKAAKNNPAFKKGRKKGIADL
jgi:hypothetical protein